MRVALALCLEGGLVALLLALFALVVGSVWRRHGFFLPQLVCGRRPDGRLGSVEIDRLQVLVVSLVGVASYAWIALTTPVGRALPEAPQMLVTLVAASHVFYLSGKIRR